MGYLFSMSLSLSVYTHCNSSLIHWLKLLIRLNSSFYDQMENWLEGFGFAGRSLTNKNFSGYNLRGCDFSSCNLQRVNFEKVVGGFSWVRPAIVTTTIAFSIRIISTLPPLPPMVLPETIHMPDQIGTCFYTLLAITLFLKLVLIALYSRKLPARIVLSKLQAEQHFWQQIKAASQAVLAIAPPYFAFGCYAFVQATLLVESLTDKLLLFLFAALFGFAAVSFFIWTVGEVFIFHSSFAGANLSNANFALAKLVQCNFKKANLYSANLQAADLRNSNFKGVPISLDKYGQPHTKQIARTTNESPIKGCPYLSRLSLGADLRLADLRGANLRGANLTNARIEGSIGIQEALHAQST
jgi:uncharacterized protein YjbI with pentapeptide repeats